jgi:hypothetical protein
MARTSRITELVVLIAEKTQQVSMGTYKQTTSLRHLYDIDGPTNLVIKSANIKELRLSTEWDLDGVARPLTRPDRMLKTSGVYQRILDRSFR